MKRLLLALLLAGPPAPALAQEPVASGPEAATGSGPETPPPPVRPTASGSLEVAIPDLSLEATGSPVAAEVPLEFTADRLEVDEGGDGYMTAAGQVRIEYQGIVVRAEHLAFDRRTLKGTANGNVRFDFGDYHLKATLLDFDLGQGTARALDYQAIIEKQGWFGGSRLFLTRTLAVSEDARISPCTQEDPGYWLAADRFEWYPQAKNWNLRGQWVRLVVSDVTVFMLPFFAATIGEEARKVKFELPESKIDATVGLDGAQGLFIDSQARYELTPDLAGTLPLRVMSNRGLSIGINQPFPTRLGEARLNANYTQHWPWFYDQKLVDWGRQGMHANLNLAHDWGGARTTVDFGYRVDVGFRSDTAYQVDPGGNPIYRLPEINTSWPAVTLGPVALSPSLRMGYVFEESSKAGAGVLAGGLGFNVAPWTPAPWWSSSFYGGTGSSYYLSDRSQSVLFLGLNNAQQWSPDFSTSFSLESQPVLTTASGSPFNYDRTSGFDRVGLGANLHVFGPWSLGAGSFWARSHDPKKQLSLADFALGDLWFSVRYNVNCLGLGVTFRPPRGGSPFQYFFDYNLVYF